MATTTLPMPSLVLWSSLHGLDRRSKASPGNPQSLGCNGVSVKRDSSSASLALARSIDWVVVSAQPDPRFSPNQHFARLHQLKLLLQSRLLLAPGDEMVRR
jgi:hypothetical protein